MVEVENVIHEKFTNTEELKVSPFKYNSSLTSDH